MNPLRRLVRTPALLHVASFALLAGWAAALGRALPAPAFSEVHPALSSVSATPQSGALADGEEEVQIQVVVRDGAGAPLAGRVVRVHSSQSADQIAQPVAPTDAQGLAVASMVSEVEGARVLWVIVDPDEEAVGLEEQPVVYFDPPPVRPNFLIILVDDIGTDSLAIFDEVNPYKTKLPYTHGHKGQGVGDVPGDSNLYVHSPNIHQLASEGVVFLNAYAMPVCSPTRAALLTGNYPVRTGVGGVCVLGNIGGALNEFGDPGFAYPTLPQLVKTVGWADILVGKWHLGMPTSDMFPPGSDTPPAPPAWTSFLGWSSIPLRGGFSQWISVFSNVNTTPRPSDGGSLYSYFLSNNQTDHSQVAWVQDEFVTTRQFDEALAWCNSQTAPFLCVLAATAAHDPWDRLPPSNLTTTAEYMQPPLNGWTGQMAQIEALDTKLGHLINGLSPLVRANTTILLIGDNGIPRVCLDQARLLGDTPAGTTGSAKNLGQTYDFLLDAPNQRFKGSVYEKGTRVPMIVAGHGVVSPGRFSTALVDVTDIYPTVAEMIGETVPSDMHGKSFLPVLADQATYATHLRDHSYTETFSPMGVAGASTAPSTTWRIGCSLRIAGQGRYKLVYSFARDATGAPVETEELYRLQDAGGAFDDPFETRPLDHGPADPERANYLLVRAKLDEIVASGAASGPQACTSSQSFCTSLPNSTGSAALISDDGPCSIALNRYTLRAGPVPNEFGLFFYAASQLNGGLGGAFGGGWLCVGDGTIHRLPIVQIQNNVLEHALDFQDLPSAPFLPNQTRHFQAWFRDTVAGGTMGNYSDGLTVTFGY